MAEDYHVGSASVDIVPDARGFQAKLDEKLKNLTATVRVKVDDKLAERELSEAARDRVAVIQAKVEDRLAKAQLDGLTRGRTAKVKVDDGGSITRTNKRVNLLLTSIVALAPAAAPVLAFAFGATSAFVGLGIAGILAFKGIEAEMKAGTPLGLIYTSVVDRMKSSLAGLQKTAASGVLAGVSESVDLVSASMPQLNSEVHFLAQSLGSDLVPLTRAALALFGLLTPVVNDLANGAHSLAVDFAAWAEGPGGRDFAAYMATVLPEVAQTLAAIAQAAAHIVEALLPLGGPVLTAIQGISIAIDHIPVRVIQTLFLLFAGYKAITLTAAAIDAVTAAMVRLGVAEAAAGAGGAGGAAAGGALSKIGPLALAAGLGTSAAKTLPLYTVGAQSDTVETGPQRAKKNFNIEHPGGDFNAFVKSTSTDPAAAAQLKKYQDESYKAVAAQKALGGAAQSAASYIAAEQAAVAANSAAMTAWTTSMDRAYTRSHDLQSANIGVHQALADASAALKTNGATLDLNTQKGRDNRTALLNVASAVHTKIDADVAAGRSQDIVNAHLETGRAELVKMAEKFGLGKTAAQRYATALLGIPKHVTTTITAKVNAISSSSLSNQAKAKAIEQAFNGPGAATGGRVLNGVIRRDGGGPVWGAGTATSDSIRALLSNGEFVFQTAAAQAIGYDKLAYVNSLGAKAAAAFTPSLGHSFSPGQVAPVAEHNVPGITFTGPVGLLPDDVARATTQRWQDALAAGG